MSSTFLADTGPDGRFWYWQGASGRKYIHTVYPAKACPPLPGAVYVAVKRIGALRTVLALGLVASGVGIPEVAGCDEIHVHLLSASQTETDTVLDDLRRGLASIALRSLEELARAA